MWLLMAYEIATTFAVSDSKLKRIKFEVFFRVQMCSMVIIETPEDLQTSFWMILKPAEKLAKNNFSAQNRDILSIFTHKLWLF